MDLEKLASIAINAALHAGRLISQSLDESFEVMNKSGGSSIASQVVTAIDLASEKEILKHLLPSCQRYDIGLLTEEGSDDGSRFEKSCFWCIDPLDGTLAFTEKRAGYSVSIALVDREGRPMIGVIYDPVSHTLYHAIKGKGAFKNQRPWLINQAHDCLTYVTDRTLDATPRAQEIKSIIEKQSKLLNLKAFRVISGGGSVINAIRVLENGPAMMLKFPKTELGGGSVWDFASSACIYHELGKKATDFKGKPLQLNPRSSTFMNECGIFFSNLPDFSFDL